MRTWFPAVKVLHIPDPLPDSEPCSIHLPQLDTIRYNFYSGVFMASLSPFFVNRPAWLVQLEIWHSEEQHPTIITDEEIRSLAAFGPTLRRLCLRLIWAEPSDAHLGSLLPNLNTLEVRGRFVAHYEEELDSAWDPLAGTFPKLERLRLVDTLDEWRDWDQQGNFNFFEKPVPIVERQNTPALRHCRVSQREDVKEGYGEHLDSICDVAKARGVEVVRDNDVLEDECWLASGRCFASRRHRHREGCRTASKRASGERHSRRGQISMR